MRCIVSNKCPETHPRRPYSPSSALGTGRAIFSLHRSIYSLSFFLSPPLSPSLCLSPYFAPWPSLLLFCLTSIHSAPLPLCLRICLCVFGTFLLACGYQPVWSGEAGSEEKYSMSSDRCLTPPIHTHFYSSQWDRVRPAVIKRKWGPENE